MPISGPTYICVDRGAGGKKVFEGIIPSARKFHGRKIRITIGHTPVKLTRDGKVVKIPPNGAGKGTGATP